MIDLRPVKANILQHQASRHYRSVDEVSYQLLKFSAMQFEMHLVVFKLNNQRCLLSGTQGVFNVLSIMPKLGTSYWICPKVNCVDLQELICNEVHQAAVKIQPSELDFTVCG